MSECKANVTTHNLTSVGKKSFNIPAFLLQSTIISVLTYYSPFPNSNHVFFLCSPDDHNVLNLTLISEESCCDAASHCNCHDNFQTLTQPHLVAILPLRSSRHLKPRRYFFFVFSQSCLCAASQLLRFFSITLTSPSSQEKLLYVSYHTAVFCWWLFS